jgi:hypothetical protein
VARAALSVDGHPQGSPPLVTQSGVRRADGAALVQARAQPVAAAAAAAESVPEPHTSRAFDKPAPRRRQPWKPPTCEDCREKAANWGLSEGKMRRWCHECAKSPGPTRAFKHLFTVNRFRVALLYGGAGRSTAQHGFGPGRHTPGRFRTPRGGAPLPLERGERAPRPRPARLAWRSRPKSARTAGRSTPPSCRTSPWTGTGSAVGCGGSVPAVVDLSRPSEAPTRSPPARGCSRSTASHRGRWPRDITMVRYYSQTRTITSTLRLVRLRP